MNNRKCHLGLCKLVILGRKKRLEISDEFTVFECAIAQFAHSKAVKWSMHSSHFFPSGVCCPGAKRHFINAVFLTSTSWFNCSKRKQKERKKIENKFYNHIYQLVRFVYNHSDKQPDISQTLINITQNRHTATVCRFSVTIGSSGRQRRLLLQFTVLMSRCATVGRQYSAPAPRRDQSVPHAESYHSAYRRMTEGGGGRREGWSHTKLAAWFIKSKRL